MIKSFYVVLTILLFSATGRALCVQSFNIYGPIYASHVGYRTYLTMKYLMSENNPCEVIQLQEVWSDRQEEQVKHLADKTYQISKPQFRSSNSGLLSLSSIPTYKSEQHEFKLNYDDGILDRIRSVIKVKKGFHSVQVAYESEPLWIVNTHLHPTSTAIRLTQIIDLAFWRKSYANQKAIFTGDFNADVNSLEWRMITLLLKWTDAVEQGLGHYPSHFCTYCKDNHRSWKNKDEVLDYIFISNNSIHSDTELFAASALRNLAGTPQFTWSDHFGIRVQLKYRNIDHPYSDEPNTNKDPRKSALFLEIQKKLLESKDSQIRAYAKKLESLF